jgi:hypothetical protein
MAAARAQRWGALRSIMGSRDKETETTVSGPLIKGTAVLDGLKALEARRGPQGVAEVVARMRPSLRSIFDGHNLSPATWYSLDAFTEFLRCTLNPGEPVTLLAQRSEAAVEKQLRGVYRMFVRFGSPAFILKRMSVVHGTYFRRVEISVCDLAKTSATIRYTGFKVQHQVLEPVIIGFYRKALQLSGANGCAVEARVPIGSGRGEAEYLIRWR